MFAGVFLGVCTGMFAVHVYGQVYGQISPREMCTPCLRAKNARFRFLFARKQGFHAPVRYL